MGLHTGSSLNGPTLDAKIYLVASSTFALGFRTIRMAEKLAFAASVFPRRIGFYNPTLASPSKLAGMRHIIPVAIAALCVFYATVMWMALNPKVSARYYEYYISRTTGLSPAEQAQLKLIKKGEQYSHADTRIGFSLWSAAEATHRWSDGDQAQIVFLLRSPSTERPPKYLAIELKTAGKQSLTWRLNNGPTHEATLSGATVWRLPLDAPLLRPGTNTLAFTFPDAARPGGDDLRELAIAVKALRFE